MEKCHILGKKDWNKKERWGAEKRGRRGATQTKGLKKENILVEQPSRGINRTKNQRNEAKRREA